MVERPSRRDVNDRPAQYRAVFRLLGDFQVTLEDRTIGDSDWRLANAAALVKILALAPGQRIHREQLVEILWPASEPAAAANSLRYALHVARRTLDPDRKPDDHLIQYRNGWLSLGSRDGLWIDVQRFERAAGAARRAADLRAHELAIELYTGDLLPGDRYEDWTFERRESLRRRYLSLLRGAARLRAERGELDLAIDTQERLIRAEPLDEDAHVQLMKLYARVGLRHQALLQYDRLREVLSAGLDTEPGMAAQQIHRKLLASRGRTGDKGRPAPRERRDTMPGTAGRAPTLPAPLTSFVGRGAELDELLRIIPAQRLVTLTGPGGAGKTRLALQAAASLESSFPDGVWLVELSDTADPQAVPQYVASALGIRDQPRHSLDATLKAHLRDSRALVILDNCEHVLDAAAKLAYDLLRACPELHILATSRELLRVPGEAVREVRPLSFPESAAPAAALMHFDAVNLFIERSRLVRPDFALTDATAPSIAEICRRLDGLPLAIELVAARVRQLTLDDIVTRLAAPFAFLDEGSRVAPERHRTLEAAIGWSYDLLPDAEQVLVRRLAVFDGGWTIDAARNVAAGGGVTGRNLAGLMSGLVDKSLVTVVDGEAGRYRFLETIRQYAMEQLDRSGEMAATRLRHANHFMQVVETAEAQLRGPEQPHWLAWWRREQHNARAGLEFLIESKLRRMSLHFGAMLWRFWLAHGQISEGRRWYARLLRDAEPEATGEYLRTLFGDGRLAYAQGDYRDATDRFAECLQLARRLDDRDFIAGSLAQLGHIAVRTGDYATARERYEEGLPIRREQGDGWLLAVVLDGLGQVSIAEGDYPAARDYYDESLALYRRSGDRTQIARALALLGHVDYRSGDFPAAREKLAESLSHAEAVNNQQAIALAYAGLGHVAIAQDDARGGARLFERSRALYDRLGVKRTATSEIDALAWPPETDENQWRASASNRADLTSPPAARCPRQSKE